MSTSPHPPMPPSGACLEAQRQLPWLVNGTLEEGEGAALLAHLATCAACRAEEASCRALAAAVAAAPEVAPRPHPGELARLLARIDHEREREERGFGLWRLLRTTPRPVRFALAAQLLLVLGLTAGLARERARAPEPAALYHTLSDPAPRATSARRIRVVFREEATEAALRDLLLPLAAEIVAGPSPLGAYTLALPGGDGADSESLVLAHLRAHALVRFAEPVARGNEP